MSNYYDEYDGEFGEKDTSAHIPYDEFLAGGGAEESAPASVHSGDDALGSGDTSGDSLSGEETNFAETKNVDSKIGKNKGQSKLVADSGSGAAEEVAEEGSKGMFGKMRDGIGNFADKVKNEAKQAGNIFKGGLFGKAKAGVGAFASSTGLSVGSAAGVLGVGGGSIIALIVALLFGAPLHRATVPLNDCDHISEVYYTNSAYKAPTESQMKGAAQSIYEVYVRDENSDPLMSPEAIMGIVSNAIGESHLDPACYEMNYRVGPTDGPSSHDMILSRNHHVSWPVYAQRMFELYEEDGTGINHTAYYYMPIGRMLFNGGQDMIVEREENGQTITTNLGPESLILSYEEHLDIQANTHPVSELQGTVPYVDDNLTGSYQYYDQDGNVQTATYNGLYCDPISGMPYVYPGVGLWQWTGPRAYELQRFGDRDPNPTDGNGDGHSDSMYALYTQLAFLKVENAAACWSDGSRANGDGKLLEVPTYTYDNNHVVYDVNQNVVDANGRDNYAQDVVGAVFNSTDYSSPLVTNANAYNSDANASREAVASYYWLNYHTTMPSIQDYDGNTFSPWAVDTDWTGGYGSNYVPGVQPSVAGGTVDPNNPTSGSTDTTHTWTYFNYPYSVSTPDGYYADGTEATPDTTYNNVSELLGRDASSYGGANWATIVGAAGSDWTDYLPDAVNTEMGTASAVFTYPHVTQNGVTSPMVLPTDIIEYHEHWTEAEFSQWISQYNIVLNTHYKIEELSYWSTQLRAKIQAATDAKAVAEAQISSIEAQISTYPKPNGGQGDPGPEPTPPTPPIGSMSQALWQKYHDDYDQYLIDHQNWEDAVQSNSEWQAYYAAIAGLQEQLRTWKAERDRCQRVIDYYSPIASNVTSMKTAAEYELNGELRSLNATEAANWARADADAQINAGGAVAVEYARWFCKNWEGARSALFKSHLNNAAGYYRLSVEEAWIDGWTDQPYNSVMQIVEDNITDIHMYDMYASEYFDRCGGNKFDNSSIASLAVSWAWPSGHPEYCDIDASDTDGEGYRIQARCTSLYVASVWIVSPHEWTFASCDRGFATACRASGSDDVFPMGACRHQRDYCQNHPETWAYVCTITSEADFELLEPGDLIVNDGHTITYTGSVGAEIAVEKWPDLGYTLEDCQYSICHSSRSQTAPRGVMFAPDGRSGVVAGNSHGQFEVYRCINPMGDASVIRQTYLDNMSVLEGLPCGAEPAGSVAGSARTASDLGVSP